MVRKSQKGGSSKYKYKSNQDCKRKYKKRTAKTKKPFILDCYCESSKKSSYFDNRIFDCNEERGIFLRDPYSGESNVSDDSIRLIKDIRNLHDIEDATNNKFTDPNSVKTALSNKYSTLDIDDNVLDYIIDYIQKEPKGSTGSMHKSSQFIESIISKFVDDAKKIKSHGASPSEIRQFLQQSIKSFENELRNMERMEREYIDMERYGRNSRDMGMDHRLNRSINNRYRRNSWNRRTGNSRTGNSRKDDITEHLIMFATDKNNRQRNFDEVVNIIEQLFQNELIGRNWKEDKMSKSLTDKLNWLDVIGTNLQHNKNYLESYIKERIADIGNKLEILKSQQGDISWNRLFGRNTRRNTRRNTLRNTRRNTRKRRWKKVKSISRPGEWSYKNLNTGEKIAWRPTEINNIIINNSRNSNSRNSNSRNITNLTVYEDVPHCDDHGHKRGKDMYKSAGQKINTPKNKVPTSIKREPRWIKITKGTNTIYVYYNESIPSLIGSFLTNCGIYNNPKILTQDQFISSKHNNEDIIPSPNDLIEQFKTKLNND